VFNDGVLVSPEISIEELEKAILTLDEALRFSEQVKNDQIQYKIARDACIQRFEYEVWNDR
jgi:hypothetical protein